MIYIYINKRNSYCNVKGEKVTAWLSFMACIMFAVWLSVSYGEDMFGWGCYYYYYYIYIYIYIISDLNFLSVLGLIIPQIYWPGALCGPKATPPTSRL
jgi:hypothetical protein